MRVWGRTGQVDGLGGTWRKVTTDANGYNDSVFFTAICHVIKLNLYESPFFADYGIPAQQSIVTQVFPDYYAAQIQRQFASCFASLTITRQPNTSPPVYNVNAVAHSGAILNAVIPT